MKTVFKSLGSIAGLMAGGLFFTPPTASAQQQPLSPQQLEFFEAKIRPALIQYCYDCHSAEGKVKGGLQVDGKIALLKGGSTGPAVVPNAPSKSLLVKAIAYKDADFQMPPDEKMPDSVIADLTEWVRMGAPDPRVGKQAGILKSDEDRNKAKEHWAFRPVVKPELPELKSNVRNWAKNEIDYFVQAKLEGTAMVPSTQADKRTLVRRAYFDLIGIPPTMKQVQDFLSDDSPSAFEKVLDDLLASEHYGERWGRYWLDIARYADTRGVQNNNQMMDNRMVHAWTYRDWVIKSLNDDMPYDKFIQKQIAADEMLKLRTASTNDLAALGFLSVYRAVNNKHEVIDDQIDVVTRGVMGLSVYCARCHDHKFDPVKTEDYYGLYGVFDSIKQVENKPLIENPAEKPMYGEYLNEKARLQYELEEFRLEKLNEYVGEAKTNTSRYMIVAHNMKVAPDAFALRSRADRDMFEEKYELEADLSQSWSRFLNNRTRKADPVFTPWKDYTQLSQTATNSNQFLQAAKKLSKKYYSNGKAAKGLNLLVAKSFSSPARNLYDVAARYQAMFFKAEGAWVNAANRNYRERIAKRDENIPEIKKLKDNDMEQLRQVFYGRGAPPNVPYSRLKRLDNRRIENQERRWHNDIELLEMNHPGAPKRAMAVEDLPRPREPKVFLKGDPSKAGKSVRRKFISLLDPSERPFSRGSGRLELAYKVGSAKNPLTPRMAVNRVWAQHFGAPIVRTPTDFGLRSADPTHPELLDHLAAWLIEKGWSMKRLHKYIMMSATYQQSSDIRPKYMTSDSANMGFWRMNRKRLDFEGFRDSLLSVAGMLDTEVGGSPYDILETPYVPRRTVYAYIDRRNLPAVFRTFDFANPNMTQGERFSSTVPQQALFLMNSPFVAELARGLIDRADVKNKIDERQKITALYETGFQRQPTEIEMKIGMRFLKQQVGVEKARKPNKIWSYGFGAYDSSIKRLVRFAELPHYSALDGAWQGGEEYPDSRLGGARVGADGGSPGPNRTIAVIRRWRSPITGTISIDGTLEHLGQAGDGVNAYIVFKGAYELGRYVAYNRDQPTKIPVLKVTAGDVLDFVVNCRGNDAGDVFYWAPNITIKKNAQDLIGNFGVASAPAGGGGNAMGGMAGGGAGMPGGNRGWNAAEDFYVEQEAAELRMLSAWEKYAQVVLLSNEMVFVD
jgi:hypothetical protein